MTVFKGYLQIMKRNTKVILIYLAIFFGLTVLSQPGSRNKSESYHAESVKIAYIDKDGGTLSKGLKAYLGKYNKMIPMKDNKAKLQENLYYQNIEYIIKVPSGFEKKCLEKGEKLSVTKFPGSYTGYYVDQQINDFLNSVRTYYAAGYSVKEACNAANSIKLTKVHMLDINGNGGEEPGYTGYFRMIPYLVLSVLLYVLGSILSSFHKPDISRRMQASAVTTRRQSLEGLLAAGVFGCIVWAVAIIGGIVFYGTSFMNSKGLPYYLLNTLVMMLVALALSYLVSLVAKSINALNGIANTLSLGMCFLCGAVVPLDVMSKGVRETAQFLPLYWYEKANDLLSQSGTIVGNIKTEILQSIGIQFVFAAAIVCIALAISKRKR